MTDAPSAAVAPGFFAFVAFFIMAMVLWFLMRNMNARMRRMSYRQQAAHRGRDEAQAGPGEWGDVAFLDRIAAAHQPPARRDELLADALAAAERAVDQTQRLRVLVDQAVAQGVEPDSGEAAAVATLAEALDTSGALEDAGAAWLAIARHTAGPALAEYDRAAELSAGPLAPGDRPSSCSKALVARRTQRSSRRASMPRRRMRAPALRPPCRCSSLMRAPVLPRPKATST